MLQLVVSQESLIRNTLSKFILTGLHSQDVKGTVTKTRKITQSDICIKHTTISYCCIRVNGLVQ